MLCDDGRVMVNLSWLTQSYHKHTIKPGVVGCLVAQHGVMEVGTKRRIYCFTKCRIGKWLVHCHPNERGKGPWYDWVMVKKNDGGVVSSIPARVASFFINEDDKDRKLRVAVQFAGTKMTQTSSVLFDIYEFAANDPANEEGQVGTYECINYTSIEKAVYAKVSSDLTKVVVVRDREKWGEAF